MKKLIPLMILATVVSCGKKTNKQDGVDMIINKLTDSQKIGLVSISSTEGESDNLDINDKNEIVGFKRESYQDSVKKIILKKENGLVYSLEISKSGDAPEHKSVILEDTADISNELRKLMESGNAEVKGNHLIVNIEEDQSYEEDFNGTKYGMKSKMKLKFKRNLKSDCESKTDIALTDVVGSINGVETKLKNAKSSEVESCGGIMNKEELKALELSKVSFCDMRVEDSNCEEKDMSFLTSDL